MASARARLGAARRGIIKRKKQTGVVTGALSALGTVAAFGAGQAKKADTAWKEYEAGYKELGGDVKDIQKPGFFKRTAQQFLPGGKTGLPEGDVTIGDTIYDRAKIQKAGSFLGSDASAILSDEQRQQYLGRTAPGRLDPSQVTKPAEGPHIYSDVEIEKMTGGGKEVPITISGHLGRVSGTVSGEDEQIAINKFRGGGGGFFPVETDFSTHETPFQFIPTPFHHNKMPVGKDAPFETTKAGGSGIDPNPRGRNLGSMWAQFKSGPLAKIKSHISKGLKETGDEFSFKDFKTVGDYGKSVLGTAAYRIGQGLEEGEEYSGQTEDWDLIEKDWKKLGHTAKKGVKLINILDEVIPEQSSFAKGGDFITNGPQKIIVGDNPGGRERVTITPLDSEDYKPKGYYGEARNLLESLYENNRRRKKY